MNDELHKTIDLVDAHLWRTVRYTYGNETHEGIVIGWSVDSRGASEVVLDYPTNQPPLGRHYTRDFIPVADVDWGSAA